jgi:hypothetical protein
MRVGTAIALPLAALLIAAAAGAAPPGQSVVIIQSSPLAGFQFHAGRALWNELRVGDALALVREPANPHDPNAVRVEWRGIKLGYVPRRENAQLARQMDLGAALEARIVRLTESRNPWRRIEFEVVLVLPEQPAPRAAPVTPPAQ